MRNTESKMLNAECVQRFAFLRLAFRMLLFFGDQHKEYY